MSETLEALVANRRMGTLSYRQDRLTFDYDAEWREDETTYQPFSSW